MASISKTTVDASSRQRLLLRLQLTRKEPGPPHRQGPDHAPPPPLLRETGRLWAEDGKHNEGAGHEASWHPPRKHDVYPRRDRGDGAATPETSGYCDFRLFVLVWLIWFDLFVFFCFACHSRVSYFLPWCSLCSFFFFFFFLTAISFDPFMCS